MNNNNINSEYFSALADLLFPEFALESAGGAQSEGREKPETAEDFERRYPPRALPEGAAVTRLGPSPTGFIHLGNLFMATVNQRLAAQSGGLFFLRVEDTDRKREVEGAIPSLIASLAYFGIGFDEGVKWETDGDGENSESLRSAQDDSKEAVWDDGELYAVRVDGGGIVERGDYGPYRQSERRGIYRAFARKLVLEGKAYPCFLTEDEIEELREGQESEKQLTGVYGSYAKWRNAELCVIQKKITAGEPYVLRLYADYAGAAAGETVTVMDGIRGAVTMPRNIMDVVILKRDGLPTYHFAHVIDDHLMRTTHVVRGEEWLSSLPVHIALFGALGFEPPGYCHTALLMKMDGGVKRKLSKRKDPELALSYYIADGYHPRAVEEYLLTVINSNYEEWRLANPLADNREFCVTTEKMGAAGLLFDLDKLQNISRDVLATVPADELAVFVLNWIARERPDELEYFLGRAALLTAALDVGRGGDKPRKDLCYAAQIFDFISYFFDPYFRMEDPLPDNIAEDEARELLAGYLADYDHGDDRERWFEKIRLLAASHGYAPKPKDYRNSPDMYKGHVGDVSTVIRCALTGRRNAPDIYEIQQILGEERTRERLKAGM